MHKFIANLGSAAHLALVAVAPLFLLPFCPAQTVATAVLALLPLIALWMLMEPSVSGGEMPHDARRRTAWRLRHDVFFWIWLVLVAYAVFSAVNSGVAYAYDPERTEWVLSSPRWAYLPGSADGAGWLPLAGIAALGLVTLAVRNAFGRNGNTALLLSVSLVAGLAGILWLRLVPTGGGHRPDGTAFGIALVMSVVAVEGAFEQKWALSLPALIVAQGGCLAALAAFAPLPTAVAFLAVWLALAVWTIFRLRGRSVFFGGVAFPLVCLSSLILAGLLLMTLAQPLAEARLADVSSGRFFPEGFFPLRAVQSDCAKSAWLASPWTGSGAGTFAMDVRAYLPAEAWQSVPRGVTASLNGWWQLLAEGGIVRVALCALAFGWLLFEWGCAVAAVVRGRAFPTEPRTWAGPASLAVVAAAGFFGSRALGVGVLMLTLVLLAVSVRAAENLARRMDNG